VRDFSGSIPADHGDEVRRSIPRGRWSIGSTCARDAGGLHRSWSGTQPVVNAEPGVRADYLSRSELLLTRPVDDVPQVSVLRTAFWYFQVVGVPTRRCQSGTSELKSVNLFRWSRPETVRRRRSSPAGAKPFHARVVHELLSSSRLRSVVDHSASERSGPTAWAHDLQKRLCWRGRRRCCGRRRILLRQDSRFASTW